MQDEKTQRGFDITNFKDRYGAGCSLQKSSLAFEECIWLGVDYANPLLLANKEHDTDKVWIKYPIPDEVILTTRMHLTQDMVKELLPYLQKFAETGEIH